MKTRLSAGARGAWSFLTVIPGWPDAGRVARTFYVLPLVVPFLVLLGLAGWMRFLQEPAMQAVRTAAAPALHLEREIVDLRLAYSEARAAEAAAATAALEAGLVRTPEDLAARLEAMRLAADNRGWNVTLHANDLVPPPPGTLLSHRTVRGRLTARPENTTAFASLLALLEEITPPSTRGSLTRLSVRADEQGQLAVELGARLPVRSPDEKTP